MEIFEIAFLCFAFVLGAMLGSFACCQAWRLRLKEENRKSPGKWSVCLSCGKRLKKSENIPILSWIFQRGKCRSCGARIGKAEIFAEVSLAFAFLALSVYFYPKLVAAVSSANFLVPLLLILKVVMLIVAITVMWILLIYDAKWQKLPNFLLVVVNIVAVVYLLLQVAGIALGLDGTPTFSQLGVNLLISATILPGLYFGLYFLSKEKLVGSGDWLVALPIALILPNWWLALVTLFLSNLLGSFFGIFQKFRRGARQIPFGPFLIIAFVAVFVLQDWLLNFAAMLQF